MSPDVKSELLSVATWKLVSKLGTKQDEFLGEIGGVAAKHNLPPNIITWQLQKLSQYQNINTSLIFFYQI